MGNAPSLEAHRKPTQRLSKARPVSHVFDLTEDPSVPDDFFASSRGHRYCDDYLSGSRRTLSYQHLPSPSQEPDWESHTAPQSPSSPPPRSPWRCSSAAPSIVASPQFQDSHVPARATSVHVATEPVAVRRPTRANTVVYPSAGDRRSLTRASSLQSNVYPPGIPRVHSDMSLSTRRRLSHWESVRRRESTYIPRVHVDVQQPAREDAFSGSVQSPESDSPSLVQATSRASYIPMRRRSLILTPGVATRAIADPPPLPSMPDIQFNRLSSTVYSESSTSPGNKFTSLPASPLFHGQDRPITPCEANYRQLGGIKFGTLRITNGSPVSTPAIENDNRFANYATSVSSTCSRPSLAVETPAWPLCGAENLGDHAQSRPKSHATEPQRGLRQPIQPVLDNTSFAFSGKDLPLRSYNPGPPKRPERAQNTITSRSKEVHQSSAETHQAASGVQAKSLKMERERNEYVTPEVLDVRKEAQLDHQDGSGQDAADLDQNHHMSRSDSGAFSTSASRQSSQRTLSNTDSGYGSNLSSRSDSTKSRPEAEKDACVVIESQPAINTKGLSTFEPDSAHRLQERRSMPLPRSSFSLLSRDKLRRLSTRVSRLPQFSSNDAMDSNPQDNSPVFDTLKRRSTFGAMDTRTAKTDQGKQGKLHRILGGTKRQSHAPPLIMPVDLAEPVPAVPENLLEKLQGRSEKPLPVSNRRMSRTSMAVPMKPLHKTGSTQQISESSVSSSLPRQTAGPKSTRSRRKSLSVLSGQVPMDYASKPLPSPPSSAEMPTVAIASRMTITRKPVGAKSKDLGSKQTHNKTPKNYSRKRDEQSQAEGFNVGSNPIAGGVKANAAPARAQPMPVKSILKTPSSPTRSQSLKSRASAPHLTISPEKIPDLPQSCSELPTKLARPLSFRARSAKTARDLLPSQVIPPIPRQSSQEALSPTGSSAPETADEGPHPPVVFRQGRQRHFRDNSGQHYRVLHSYNSPAYRNVPIWG